MSGSAAGPTLAPETRRFATPLEGWLSLKGHKNMEGYSRQMTFSDCGKEREAHLFLWYVLYQYGLFSVQNVSQNVDKRFIPMIE